MTADDTNQDQAEPGQDLTEWDKGYRGVVTDPTPNSAYGAAAQGAAVLAGEHDPSMDPDGQPALVSIDGGGNADGGQVGAPDSLAAIDGGEAIDPPDQAPDSVAPAPADDLGINGGDPLPDDDGPDLGDGPVDGTSDTAGAEEV